jgi:HlyD family secretion protein
MGSLLSLIYLRIKFVNNCRRTKAVQFFIKSFVNVRDGEAVKRKVLLGESSYSYVEVKDGLSEGEVVITSDMSRYADKNKLKFRNWIKDSRIPV